MPIPALAPLLGTVEVHHEFVRHLMQRLALTQPQNRLRPHSGTWMRIQNPHLTQRLLLNLDLS